MADFISSSPTVLVFLAPEAVIGFAKIGSREWADIVAQAVRFFGDTYPRDREKRIAMLPPMSGRARADWDPFDALDNRFYAWLEPDRHRWDLLADRYAADAQLTGEGCEP
jgi:hypothetical protein